MSEELPSAADVEAAMEMLQLLSPEAGGPPPKLRKGVGKAVALLAAEYKHCALVSECTSCGTPFADDALFCNHCGTKRASLAKKESLWRGAVKAKPYDEMRDAKGKCRAAYVGVVQVFDKILKDKQSKRINNFPEESLKCFKGDNRMYHIPRMLTSAERDMLTRGIAQRARALRRLVMDVNARSTMRISQLDCIKNHVLPESVFQRVIARAGEQWTQHLVQANGNGSGGGPRANKLYWSMWYGPDIIRGPGENGGHQWYVVEDNLGYVGGFGDLALARQVLLGEANGTNGFPELKSFLREDKTEELYDQMAAHYKRQVAEGEQVVILYYPRSVRDDNEDRRVIQLFARRGIIPVQLPGEDGPRDDQPKLVVRGGRVILATPVKEKADSGGGAGGGAAAGKAQAQAAGSAARSRSPVPTRRSPARAANSPTREKKTKMKEEPVGLVVLLSEPCDVEPGHESTKLRTAIEEARSRISDSIEVKKKEELKATRAEKTILSVSSKVDFLDTSGNKHVIQMKGTKLVWSINFKDSKETERNNGPLRWNESTSKISTSEGHSYKPDADGLKNLEQHWTISDLPINAELAKAQADDLRNAVEAVGQLVGGRINRNARDELFRILRRDDKESWQTLIEGKQGVAGLLGAYYAGRVKIANGPGLIHVEDKELCAHVDKLIKHYLGEEPILRTIPTLSFATEEDLIQRVFDDPKTQADVVVKRVDGRGGNAVWVGAKLPRADFLAARPLVVAEPEAFIVQRYTALSEVDGQMVDIRGPAFITSVDEELSGGPGVAVSPVLWGRGVPSEGSNGKVNISDAGFEFAIATAA
eukprot:TRINITY_DN39574_c0_g1_i1.p1 TRINITY_DN39574_c0_g1~~TRINITY_DN39574_c0_g1_i1.p1  ORF type:complete len:819 (+),score=167.51 TRINITY_DN39574_c0_g1_i1:85-2541(+)